MSADRIGRDDRTWQGPRIRVPDDEVDAMRSIVDANRRALGLPPQQRADDEPGGRDPHVEYGVHDPYDYPGWPLVSRIVAIATDTKPTMPDETDGVDEAVTGLLADLEWRRNIAIADTMGLVGDWGVDDVEEAVTNALHEHRDLRKLGDALATAAATLLAHDDTDAPADLTGELGQAVRAWKAAR